MADDVFDDDDCVVDQDADAEDECEERHAVERVAKQIEDAEGERQGDRDGEQNDARLSPAEKDRDQQRDRESGEQQMLQQFVGLRFCRLAVVARCRDVEIAGKRIAF